MNILLTGGHGFLGSHIVEEFINNKYTGIDFDKDFNKRVVVASSTTVVNRFSTIHFPSRSVLDLMNLEDIVNYGNHYRIDSIIHAAGEVGGLQFNKENPGWLTYTNLQMGLNLIEASRLLKVKRFLLLSTTCGYPEIPKTIPFIESELYDGLPEKTNAGYGMAKRTLIKVLQEYNAQYGLSNISLIPTNLVGPGDCFDDHRSHVIAAIIKKFEMAKKNGDRFIKLFGSGTSTRDFLYVKDCTRAIKIAFESNINNEIINLGSGREISIKQLAELIHNIGNYDIDYIFTGEVGNGQPRRCLNINKANSLLGWKPETSLEEAVKETINWYRSSLNG